MRAAASSRPAFDAADSSGSGIRAIHSASRSSAFSSTTREPTRGMRAPPSVAIR